MGIWRRNWKKETLESAARPGIPCRPNAPGFPPEQHDDQASTSRNGRRQQKPGTSRLGVTAKSRRDHKSGFERAITTPLRRQVPGRDPGRPAGQGQTGRKKPWRPATAVPQAGGSPQKAVAINPSSAEEPLGKGQKKRPGRQPDGAHAGPLQPRRRTEAPPTVSEAYRDLRPCNSAAGSQR